MIQENYGDLRTRPEQRDRLNADTQAHMAKIRELLGDKCEDFRYETRNGRNGYAGEFYGYFLRPSEGFGVSLTVTHDPKEVNTRVDGLYAYLQIRSMTGKSVDPKFQEQNRIIVKGLSLGLIVNQIAQLLSARPTDEQLKG